MFHLLCACNLHTHVQVHVCVRVCAHVCGGWRTTVGPTTWVLGVELSSSSMFT